MNRLLVCAALAFVTALCLAVAQPVRAQFETPNRSFHEAASFRLEGRHLTVPCASCHINGQYQGTPATCYACHWVRRKDDRYQTRLGTQCEQCHQPVSWTAVRWEHASTTGVALNASHRSVSCVSCHRDGNFNTGMVVCASCHRKDYDATRSPNHAAAGFSVNCESCHRPGDATWRTGVGGDFNHNAVFPLQGIHATVSCTSCHRSNVYKGTGRECVSCHQADYNATKNPNHAAAGFSTACETCHRPGGPQWGGGGGTSFNHNAVFQLVGVHATQACASCHRNSVFKGTARDCVGCHQADYNRAQNPNHVAAGFSTSCESCHRASDLQWRGGAPFNHNAVFQLVGVHATQACTSCHRNNVFKGTSRDVCRLPSGRLQRHAQPESRRRRILDLVRDLPSRGGLSMERCHVQPQCRLPVGRHARRAGVYKLPPQQRIQGHGTHVRRLPSGQLQRHAESESRRHRLPDDVRELPPGNRHQLDAGTLYSHVVPAQRTAQPAVRAMSHDAERVYAVQLHDVPCPRRNRQPSQGRARIPV